MEIKWSRFNFLVEANNNLKFLYNTYTNSLLRLNESLFADLINISKIEVLNEDSLSSFSEEEISFFKKNYILVEDDENLVDILHHQSLSRLYSKKHLVLTVAPTQSCNFNCSYCFEKWRKSPPMTDETENALVNYIEKQRKEEGLDTISLTWYGGEPLLQINRIISLNNRINQLGLTTNHNQVITNGYYFTPDIVRKLIDTNILSIQITIDGFKETHDSHRPLINGQGSFDTIIKNLDHYFNSEYRDKLSIAIRVNVDKNNIATFIEIHKWLSDRYKSDMLFIYPGIIVLNDTDVNYSSCLSRDNVTDFVLDLYNKYDIVTEKLYPEDINIECMSRSPYSMLVGSRGEIYKCFEDLGNKELEIGNINNSDVWTNYDHIAKYSVGIDHYNDKNCRACRYLPICRGGCPIRRLENVYKGKSNDCCTPFKSRIADYIEIYSRLIQKRT